MDMKSKIMKLASDLQGRYMDQMVEEHNQVNDPEANVRFWKARGAVNALAVLMEQISEMEVSR